VATYGEMINAVLTAARNSAQTPTAQREARDRGRRARRRDDDRTQPAREDRDAERGPGGLLDPTDFGINDFLSSSRSPGRPTP
jgi:hypothetical protein